MLKIRKYMDVISISFEEMILQMKKEVLKEKRLAGARVKMQAPEDKSGISEDEPSLENGSADQEGRASSMSQSNAAKAPGAMKTRK